MSEYGVPRAMEATTTRSAVRASYMRAAKPNGWWGMAILIASEATLFGAFFGTYYYLRFHNVAWPPPGTPKPKVVVPLILVGTLAARARRLKAAWLSLFVAFFVQCGYFAFELHDLQDQLSKSRPQDNAYSSIYFTLVITHHAHVAVGLALDAWLLWKLGRGITNYRLVGLRSVVLYWHFVNLLTLLVIGCLLSPNV